MMEASIDSKLDPFTKRLIAAVALSWLVLALWSRSRYAPYLNHEILEGLPLTVSVEYVALLLIFVAGWALMIVAMMVPGILPLVTRVRHEAEGARPAVLVMAGYVGVWTIFGGLAHAGDVFVHEATHRFGWLGANEWVLSAGLLALAGVYQLTPFKRACLRAHRATGAPGQKRHPAQVGLWHGLSCTGCCGPLMLLMFGVACGNVPVMLLLGTIMVVEKQASWGGRITVPLGMVLLGLSVIASLSGSGVL
jgi:predicted metal-binding membrane protein